MANPAQDENIIAIGDIHGCIDQLEEILSQTRKYPEHRLVFLGDYIDRGPDSEAVCQRLMTLDAVFLEGNHEQMLTERINRFPALRRQTLSIAGLSESSLRWIETKLTNLHITENYIFVHAGFDVKKSLQEQTPDDYLWIRYSGDYLSLTSKTVVHGHVIVKTPDTRGNRVNINTGCGIGGRLTALVLPNMEFLVSSPSPGAYYDWESIRKELSKEIGELEIEDE